MSGGTDASEASEVLAVSPSGLVSAFFTHFYLPVLPFCPNSLSILTLTVWYLVVQLGSVP